MRRKIVSLSSGKDTPFKAAAESSPGRLDERDADGIIIPLLMLASKDENAGVVTKFEERLNVPKQFVTFSDQIHGWMSARYATWSGPNIGHADSW